MTQSLFKKTLFTGVLGLAMSATVAFAGPLNGLRDTVEGMDLTASGTVFNQTLYQGYVGLSESLHQLSGNHDDVELFNHKAVISGHEAPADAEEVMDRVLDTGEQQVFQTALFRLRDAYNAGSREFAPALSATAQVSYDCWIEAVEDDATSRASDCKDRFEQSLASAEAISTKQIVAITISPPLRAVDMNAPVQQEIVPQAVLDQYFVLPFEFDKTVLIPRGEDDLRGAIDALTQYQSLRVNMTAHADRAGSTAYNKRLSQRRADKVLARLVQAGVSADRVDYVESVGEGRPMVATADGVPEQNNRVVELDLKQQ